MTSLAQTEVFRDYQLLANNFPSFLIFREDDFPFEKYISSYFTFLYTYFVSEEQLHYFLNILQCSFCSNLKGIRTEMNRQEDPSSPIFRSCREINNLNKRFFVILLGLDWVGPRAAGGGRAWPLQWISVFCRRNQEGPGGEKRPG